MRQCRWALIYHFDKFVLPLQAIFLINFAGNSPMEGPKTQMIQKKSNRNKKLTEWKIKVRKIMNRETKTQ